MSEAESMLDQLALAHEKLLLASPDPISAKGLEEVRKGLLAELSRIGPQRLGQRPLPDEWSAREVMEHLVAHDMKHQEIETRGLGHYVEHGRAHIDQLAQIGRRLASA